MDQWSERTASVDWKVPRFHDHTADYYAEHDSVFMTEMEDDFRSDTGKAARKREGGGGGGGGSSSIGGEFLPSGRARVAWELGRERKVQLPYGGTNRERLSRLFYTSLCILITLFLINAAIVSLALWRLSRLSPQDLTIETLRLANFDEASPKFSVRAHLPDRWYYKLFNVIFHEPTVVKIYVPEAFKREQDRWKPIVTTRLPRMDIGRGGRTIDWSSVPLTIDASSSLQELVAYFDPLAASAGGRRVEVRVEFEIETTSYWVPIRFSHSIHQKLKLADLAVAPSATKLLPTLDSLELLDEDPKAAGGGRFAVRLMIKYPRKVLPAFLQVLLPATIIDVGYIEEGGPRALDRNSFAEVQILPHELRAERTGPEFGVLQVEVSSDRERSKALVRVLEKIRDAQWGWSLLIGANPSLRGESASVLQRWLTTLSHELSVPQLIKLASSSAGKILSKRAAPLTEAVLSVGLVEIDDSAGHPRFVTKVSIENQYLSRLLFNLDIAMVKGRLPPVTVRAVVEMGDREEKSSDVAIIELAHQSPAPDAKQTDFLIYTSLYDVSPFVKAGHKMIKMQRLEKIAEELGEYRAFIVTVVGEDRVMDSIIRVFEMKWTLVKGGGLSFRNGEQRPIKLAIFGGAAEGATELEARPVRHALKVDVSTDAESVVCNGRLTFPKTPAFDTPFVDVYWEAIDLTVFLHQSRNLDHIQLLDFSVKKGHGRMLLAPHSPLQLLHRGSFAYVLTVHHSDALIKSEPALLAAWRHLMAQFVPPLHFPTIKVVGRIGKRKLDFATVLPARGMFMEEKRDWPRWVADVIKTRVRVAGLDGATLQVLLELPPLGQCSSKRLRNYKTAVGISMSFPAINANGCIYPHKKSTRKGGNSCIVRVGMHPIDVSVDLIDGRFCGITTRLTGHPADRRLKSRRVKIRKRTAKKLRAKGKSLNGGSRMLSLRGRGEERGGGSGGNRDEALINFLPLSVAIIDLRGALEALDRLVSQRLRKVKTSLGFSDPRHLTSQKFTLLDRMINGVSPYFLSLPLHSKKTRPRTRPPVDTFYDKSPLSVKVDLESADVNNLCGRVTIQIPPECVTKGRGRRGRGNYGGDKDDEHHVNLKSRRQSLALLLSVQWERTLMVARYGQSWAQLRVSPGQVTFRLDEDRVLLGNHDGVPTTDTITIEFAVRAHPENFSTATVRRVLSHMHNFAKGRVTDTISRSVLKALPTRSVRLEIHTFIPPHKRSAKGAGRGLVGTGRRLSTVHGDGGKGRGGEGPIRYKFRQDLPLHILLKFWIRVGRRLGGGKGGLVDQSKFSMVAKPKAIPGVEEYHLPCFIPSMCSAKELRRRAPQGPLVSVHVSLFNIIQPVVDMVGVWTAWLLDKLNFRQYPKYVAVRVCVPRLRLALAVNDMDAFEVDLYPITIERVARLVYPEHPKPTKRQLKHRHEDVLHVTALLGLPPEFSQLGGLLFPYKIDPAMSLNIDPPPELSRLGKAVPVHYSPINISFSTERLARSNLLSTLLCLLIPETPTAPLPSFSIKGDTPMRMLDTSRDHMKLLLTGIILKNPIPFLTVIIEEPVTWNYVYQDRYTFVKVRIGQLKLLPGPNRLNAVVTVSRTAFGQAKVPVGSYFPELSQFLLGLAVGEPLKVTSVIEFASVFRLIIKMDFPKRPASMGVYNPKLAHWTLRDVLDVLKVATGAPGGAMRATKSAAGKLASGVGKSWNWATSYASSAASWVFGKGTTATEGRKDEGADGVTENESDYDDDDADDDDDDDGDNNYRVDEGDSGQRMRKDSDQARLLRRGIDDDRGAVGEREWGCGTEAGESSSREEDGDDDYDECYSAESSFASSPGGDNLLPAVPLAPLDIAASPPPLSPKSGWGARARKAYGWCRSWLPGAVPAQVTIQQPPASETSQGERRVRIISVVEEEETVQGAETSPIINVLDNDDPRGSQISGIYEQQDATHLSPDYKESGEEELLVSADNDEEEAEDDFEELTVVEPIRISPLPAIPSSIRQMISEAERKVPEKALEIDTPSSPSDTEDDLAVEQSPHQLPERLPLELPVPLHSSPSIAAPDSVATDSAAPEPTPPSPLLQPERKRKRVRFESDKDLSRPTVPVAVIHEPALPPRRTRKKPANPVVPTAQAASQASELPRSVPVRSPSSRPKKTPERRASSKSPALRSGEAMNRAKAHAEASFYERGGHLNYREMVQLLTGDFSGADWETPIDESSPLVVGGNSPARGLVRTIVSEDEDDEFKEPNKNNRIPRKYRRLIALAEEAEQKVIDQKNPDDAGWIRPKRKRSHKSSWKEKSKRAKKSQWLLFSSPSRSSSSSASTSEEEPKASHGGGGKKRHHKRSPDQEFHHYGSFSDEGSGIRTPSESSLGDGQEGETGLPESGRSAGKGSEWHLRWSEWLRGLSYKQLFKVNYHLGFRNTYDYPLIMAMRVNIGFKDPVGELVSPVTKRLRAALGGAPKQEAVGRMTIAPPKCSVGALGEAQFMACTHENIRQSPINLAPRHEMTLGETVVANIAVPNAQDYPQVVDQLVYGDGLCLRWHESLVMVGLGMPGEEGEHKDPFVMDLLMKMDDMEINRKPCSDPCHTRSLACLPKTTIDLFQGVTMQRYSPPPRVEQNHQQPTPPTGAETTPPPNKERQQLKTTGVTTDKVSSGEVMRMWNKKKIPTNTNMVIHFKFRFSLLTSPRSNIRKTSPPSPQQQPQQELPGWALVFHTGRIPDLTESTDYGYVGLRNSLAVVCDPLSKRIAVFRGGENTPIMSKESAPFPPQLLDGKMYAAMVQYYPHAKYLAVAIFSVARPEHRYAAVFEDLDIRDILGYPSHVHVGFTTAVGGFAVPLIADVSLRAPLPDLRQSRIYFLGNLSPRAHQKGRFLLNLYDSCGRLMPTSPVPIKVRLRRVEARRSKSGSRDSDDSIVAIPRARPVRCKVKSYADSAVHMVSCRAEHPGTYRVEVALTRRPKKVLDGHPMVRLNWYQVKYHRFYVRNLW